MTGRSVRLERCDNCQRTTVWVPHPAGWRCESCSLCTDNWQSTLDQAARTDGGAQ